MIERVCTLQELFCAPEIRKIVGAVGALPSLSTTYTSLTQAVGDPNTSIAHVANVIEHDVAMSAKILQLVNSAFFGLAQSVTSLTSAVSYLGMETIKNLALTTETFRVFPLDSRIHSSVFETIQQHAHRAASIARVLPIDPKSRDVTIVSALLHDVGRLILASKMPDVFCLVLSQASERKCEPFEAEETLLGTSHAEIGAYLLGLWGIPNLASEAIAHHHRPTRIPHCGFDISTAVYVSCLLARELEIHPADSTGSQLREPDRACLETLGIMAQYSEFRQLAIR